MSGATEWTFADLDPAQAAKGSLPPRIPIPADAPELQTGQLTRARVAAWADQLAAELPDDPLVEALAPLRRKEPAWQRLEPLLAAEDWERSLPVLEEILAIDPADAAARFNRASALRGTGEPQAALAELEAIAPTFADEGIYHANVARTYEELGRRDAAVAAYERALELLPEDEFVIGQLIGLGALVHVEGPQGEALAVPRADFESGVREDLGAHADDAGYCAGVAEALLGGGHDELARAAAELALAAEPGRADAELFAGVAQARLGLLQPALAHIDRHLQSVPASAAGHLNRAHVLHALGRQADAVAAAERSLELDPNAITAYQVVVAGDDGPEAALARALPLAERHAGGWAGWRVAGDLAMSAGNEDAALEHWRRAVAHGADDATTATLLGELGRRGRIDELVELADGIFRLSERDPGLRWNVASGYAEGGRAAEARIVFASIAHDPAVAPDLRAAAQARLVELEGG